MRRVWPSGKPSSRSHSTFESGTSSPPPRGRTTLYSRCMFAFLSHVSAANVCRSRPSSGSNFGTNERPSSRYAFGLQYGRTTAALRFRAAAFAFSFERIVTRRDAQSPKRSGVVCGRFVL